MKYVICAGSSAIDPPKQLLKVNGEVIIERTIRLLKENGVKDIIVSSSNPLFDKYGRLDYDSSGDWVNCFPPIDEPVCYIFGDVYFSPEAIKTIVEMDTDSIEFFASAPPFSEYYRFRAAIRTTKSLKPLFNRHPISWELWQVIKGTPLNEINYTNYTVINDYSCDIDYPEDIGQWTF